MRPVSERFKNRSFRKTTNTKLSRIEKVTGDRILWRGKDGRIKCVGGISMQEEIRQVSERFKNRSFRKTRNRIEWNRKEKWEWEFIRKRKIKSKVCWWNFYGTVVVKKVEEKKEDNGSELLKKNNNVNMKDKKKDKEEN